MYDINTYAYTIPHTHENYWDFTILTEGTILHVINGKKQKIEKNALFFACKGDSHYFKCSSGEIRYINIMVRDEFVQEFFKLYPVCYSNLFYGEKRAFPLSDELIFKIENILRKINLVTFQRDAQSRMLHSVFLLLISQIFTDSLNLPHEATPESGPFFSALSKAMQNPAFPGYMVNDLCVKLNYSRMQLNRLFKKYLNMTPHDYLVDYKLDYAKNLLLNTSLKITDIAIATGYATLSQFNLNFKKKFGIPPREYRKQAKN